MAKPGSILGGQLALFLGILIAENLFFFYEVRGYPWYTYAAFNAIILPLAVLFGLTYRAYRTDERFPPYGYWWRVRSYPRNCCQYCGAVLDTVTGRCPNCLLRE